MKLNVKQSERERIVTVRETQTRTELNVIYNTLVDAHSDDLLEFAVAQWKDSGRGVVKIAVEKDFDISYLSQSDFKSEFGIHKAHFIQMKDVLAKYEPDTQFVVMIVDSKGTSFLIHSKRHLKKN